MGISTEELTKSPQTLKKVIYAWNEIFVVQRINIEKWELGISTEELTKSPQTLNKVIDAWNEIFLFRE